MNGIKCQICGAIPPLICPLLLTADTETAVIKVVILAHEIARIPWTRKMHYKLQMKLTPFCCANTNS